MATRALLPTLLLLLIAGAATATAARAGTPAPRPRPAPGGFLPIRNVSEPHIQELGGWAVAEHVRLANDGLRFVKVTGGEHQVVAGENYRLVLNATNADGKLAAYGALVFEQWWTNTRLLRCFEPANK